MHTTHQSNGFNDVIYLDAVHNKYVEEVSSCNIFAVFKERGGVRIVTPTLRGTILPGVTRKSVIELVKSEGPDRKVVGLELLDKGIAREGCELYSGEKKIGVVTSGTMSPTLDKAIAMGYVQNEYAKRGTGLEVDIRGKRKKVRVVPRRFYSRSQEG